MTGTLASPRLATPPRPAAAIPSQTRLHPFIALRAIRTLLRDPADTRQVFVILRAMRGRSGERMLARFAADPTGAALLHTRPDLLAPLNDSAALAALPDASLGRAYLRFMAEANLQADGLLAAQAAIPTTSGPDDLAFLRSRMRDQHDLLHVITGYSPDPHGELRLLAFNHAQTAQPGMAMIVLLACLRTGFGHTGRFVWRSAWQAWRRGRRATWLPAVAWEAALATPLSTLRAELNLTYPSLTQGTAA